MVFPTRRALYSLLLILAVLLTTGFSINAPQTVLIEGDGPESFPPMRLRTNVELYAADYNGDRFGDLAALSPQVDYTKLSTLIPKAGAVNIVYGSPSGLTTKKNIQLFIEGQYLQPNAFFGNSAASGDTDADGITDLAVGAPGALFGMDSSAGLISFYKGTRKGLKYFGSLGGDRPNLFLGSSMAMGDFNGDGHFDLASGAIGYNVSGKINAGAVYTYSGPDLKFSARWTLASAGIKGTPKAQDLFGSRLFSADINNDRYYDLIIGSGSGDKQTGYANILYGSAKGLTSKGNQFVRLSNRTPGDFFAYNVSACYCNDDDFADVVFTVPGYQKNKGAAFLIDGTAKGLSKTRSAFLESPWGREGDRFGYAVGALGIKRMYTLAFGSPDAVYNNDQNAGRVDLFDLGHLKWTPFFLGGGNLTGRNFGKSLAYTADLRTGHYFLSAGAPGSTVSGKTSAGSFTSGRVNFTLSGSVTIGNRKNFNLGKLAGINQSGAQFATDFANFPLIRD